MRLRESIAATVSKGDLRQDDNAEAGSDRVAALGRANALGAAMLRVIADHDGQSFLAAGVLLAKRIQRGRESRNMLLKIAAVAIHEWLADKCRKCGGRGFVIANDVSHACTACLGLAIRRHADTDRMRALGIDRHAYGRWERRFADAHTALADAITQAQHQCARQLGRNSL